MPSPSEFVHMPIDASMRQRAKKEEAARRIDRTRASPVDAYIGILGELVWAKLRYGDISRFDTLHTKGKVDDASAAVSVEVKTSKTAVHAGAHLMVREDYARSRRPDYYVLVLISSAQRDGEEVDGCVCGWATHDEVISAPLIERKSTKTGSSQGYRCYEVAARDLHLLSELPLELVGLRSNN
jgi:hypothetical protein